MYVLGRARTFLSACPAQLTVPERVMSMNIPITVTVNGAVHDAEVEPRTLLAYFLRDTLRLTGTHIGCDTSTCGACTVHLDGNPVKSCTVLAVQANGHAVTTIEGLETDGALHPLQESFWTDHGLQCGYCTPGMIMSGVALLERNGNPTVEDVRHALEGNLCRCTGYHNIIRAVLDAATVTRGEVKE
jgi:aerobic carbon-monoxide dehydrogenase small subunit